MSTIDIPALRALVEKNETWAITVSKETATALLDAYEERERLKRPMTTMRERIAKAIMTHWYPEYDFERPPTQKMRDDFLTCADAVLAELENPTPKMIEYGHGETTARCDILSEEFRAAFIAAIKAAKQV